jgi:RNA polymerase sigma-70 factor (family 1)
MKVTYTNNNTDFNAVVALVQGDKSAFESIYKTYAKEMFAYCRKSIADKDDCREIIQDVFVSLWERHEKLRVTSLRHYLFSSVRYKIIRHFQHTTVKRKYESHFRFFESIYETMNEGSLEPIGISLETKISNIIIDLPKRCQDAFTLRLTQSLSNGEIAERMNISKKTVEVYMTKAFNHLRNSSKKILEAV